MDYLKEYYKIHNDFHEAEIDWKIEKSKKFVDYFLDKEKKVSINILDVGGNGMFLEKISKYIRDNYKITVNKYGMDLDDIALSLQRKNNPDLVETIQADICKHTSFEDKKFDIVFCNDVIEHVYDDIAALKELSRISNYVYFKQPLDRCFFFYFLFSIIKYLIHFFLNEKVMHQSTKNAIG